MKNIAVVYSPESSEEIKINSKLFDWIPVKHREYFLNKIPVAWNLENIPLIESDIFLVQFPYILNNLKKGEEKKVFSACSKTLKLLKKLQVEGLVLESNLQKERLIRSYFNSVGNIRLFDGKSVFRGSIIPIIKLICSLTKIRIDSIKLGIIVNYPDKAGLNIIKKIANEIRFLSILSGRMENLIPITEEIYDDNGLIIEVSEDSIVLSDADIIINLNKEQIPEVKTIKKPIVINYEGGVDRENTKGITINDIYLYNERLVIKKYNWISQSNFCEAMIAKNEYNKFDNNNLNVTENLIKKMGYKISGFIGLNGKIKMKEFETINKASYHKI